MVVCTFTWIHVDFIPLWRHLFWHSSSKPYKILSVAVSFARYIFQNVSLILNLDRLKPLPRPWLWPQSLPWTWLQPFPPYNPELISTIISSQINFLFLITIYNVTVGIKYSFGVTKIHIINYIIFSKKTKGIPYFWT